MLFAVCCSANPFTNGMSYQRVCGRAREYQKHGFIKDYKPLILNTLIEYSKLMVACTSILDKTVS